MPRGDRTGPMGAGPMTGRGVGLCAGYNAPGFANPGFGGGFGYGRGRGFGRGFGMGGGRGWRHQYYATGLPRWARGYAYPYVNPMAFPAPRMAREEELAYLKDQARYLKEAMDDIETRVKELQQETENIARTQKKE